MWWRIVRLAAPLVGKRAWKYLVEHHGREAQKARELQQAAAAKLVHLQ